MKKRILASLDHIREEVVEKQLSLSLIMAAMIAILSSFSFFERLESVTYRLASSMEIPFLSNTAVLAEGKASIPRVLLISSNMYEQAFYQRSPLDRARLAAVFDGILHGRPGLLAVDLDISPAADAGQEQLDRLLLASAHHTKIVLATPFPVETPQLKQEKMRWMQKLCEGGVHFGVPTLHATDGMVLRYSPNTPTFANVAARLIKTTGVHGEGHAPAGHGHPPGPQEASACDKVAEGHTERADFLDPGYFVNTEGNGPSLKSLKLINANFFDAALEPNISAISSLADIPGDAELAGRVVFLGGQYGIDDRFETLNGERYGSVVHAAIFYSLTHPLKEIPEWICRLVDVLLGTLLATLFQALWRKYYQNHLLYLQLKAAESHEQRILRASAFGRSVITLLGVLAVSALVLWVLLMASTLALKHGSQFSIAFMAFAMLVYCVEWNRKGSAQEEIRLKLETLKQQISDPAQAQRSPVALIEQLLAGSKAHHTERVRGFVGETANHMRAFLIRRWYDLRFIFVALPRTPLASLWATCEFLTSLVPIAAVAWVVIEAFLE